MTSARSGAGATQPESNRPRNSVNRLAVVRPGQPHGEGANVVGADQPGELVDPGATQCSLSWVDRARSRRRYGGHVAVAPQRHAEKDETRSAERNAAPVSMSIWRSFSTFARRNLGEKTQNVHAAKRRENERRDADPHESRVEHGVANSPSVVNAHASD